jgi:BNR repeat-containing family member
VLRTFALKQYLPDAGTPFSSLAKGTFEREQGEPTVSASRENLPYTSQSIRAARKGKSIKIDLFRDPSYRGRGKSGIMPGRRRNWQLVRAICLFVATVMVLTMGLGKTLAADRVAGNLIQFNENGAWCWYQDPRLVVDPANQTLLVSSVATEEGFDGKNRGGDVDVVAYHFDSGARERFVLHQAFEPQDDHNAAALLIRPDGKYLAVYARHNHDNVTYWRVSTKPHDVGDWGDEQSFDWSDAIKAAKAHSHVTYSNLFYLPAEGRTYDFSRAINDDPSILISADQGNTWSYAAKLLTEEKLGYVNGYTKYTSNGKDRIDFITTEHHPRDYNNSIYHGYIQGGKLHQSDGTVVDEDIFHSSGLPQTELTRVFSANSMFEGTIMTHAWTMQVGLDPAGQPIALVSARADDQPENSNFSDHRFFYCRWDGKQWQANELAKAGACLWDAEQDYTGLATLDPNDPNVVYVSTTVDPRNGAKLARHEIFTGRTSDLGKSWSWTAITLDSSIDNLRPLAVASGDSTVLVWFRGTMSRSQHYDSAMVGVIVGKNSSAGSIQYVSASGLAAGTYNAFAFFWSAPTEDQQIGAGLSGDGLGQYRTRSCQTAEAAQFASPVKVEDGNRLLYRAYLGRLTVGSDGSAAAFVDGAGVAGVGFAKVN